MSTFLAAAVWALPVLLLLIGLAWADRDERTTLPRDRTERQAHD